MRATGGITRGGWRVAALAALGAVVGCRGAGASVPVEGSGRVVTEEREVGPFTAVEVTDAINAEVTAGPAQSVRVVGDDNVASLVETAVERGRLRVRMRGGGAFRSRVGVRVVLSTPRLDAVSASAASRIEASEVTGEALRVDARGASVVLANGAVRRLTVTLRDASSALLSELSAAALEVDIDGASVARVRATEVARGTLDGASRLYVHGAPAVRAVTATGAASVIYR